MVGSDVPLCARDSRVHCRTMPPHGSTQFVVPRRMPNAATLDPKEDDAMQCVDRMRPELQSIIDHGFGLNALIWAINMNFAELVKLRGGDDYWVVKVMAAFSELNRKQRDQAQVCYRRIKKVREKLQASGFSLDAIIWALIGAIGN